MAAGARRLTRRYPTHAPCPFMSDLLPVADAQSRMLAAISPVGAETVSVAGAGGRILARDLTARLSQPPSDVSAMDGYAVRAADVETVPATLQVIGEAPAGAGFGGTIGPGEAVRIFTGAPVPAGADTIVIQEDTGRDGNRVTVREGAAAGTYVRPRGLDFAEGDVLLEAGRRLSPRDVGLAAAMNIPWLQVSRRPRVAILATGDEVVMPGDPVGPDQIVSSNGWALAAFVEANGGIATNLGIAPDNEEALRTMARAAAGADLLVTTGGASVGDHDLIQSALGDIGLELDFWRIAMRPGKPLLFGRLGDVPVLGLPGNPVSSMVCALVFLAPVLAALQGESAAQRLARATLGSNLGENDRRQDYLRATLARNDLGELVATPFPRQDSSMLSLLARADCLIVRPPHDPALAAGAEVSILPMTKDQTVV